MHPTPLTEPQARAFAHAWYAAWNAHDLPAIMAHYAESIEHCSPLVKRYHGTDDPWLRGRAPLRDYFAHALDRNPALHFEPLHLAVGAESVVLIYRRMGVATGIPGTPGTPDLPNPLAAEFCWLNTDAVIVRSLSHYETR